MGSGTSTNTVVHNHLEQQGCLRSEVGHPGQTAQNKEEGKGEQKTKQGEQKQKGKTEVPRTEERDRPYLIPVRVHTSHGAMATANCRVLERSQRYILEKRKFQL